MWQTQQFSCEESAWDERNSGMRMDMGEIVQLCQLNFSQQPPIKMGGFGGREGGGVKPVHKDGSLVPYIVGTCPPSSTAASHCYAAPHK